MVDEIVGSDNERGVMQPDHGLFRVLSRDFSLIRLKGKVPVEKGWQQYCEHKRDFDEIEFQPGDNAGIACGPASGLIVLDVDNWDLFKSGNYKVNHTTLTVRTGGGGTHYYYSYPDNGKTYECRSRKAEGFDVRAMGGQVVATGSIHPDTGKPYLIIDDLPIAPAPQWLLDLAVKEPRRETLPPQDKTPWQGDIDSLPISPETKRLITDPPPVGARSEAIMSVLNALVWANLSDSDIFSIFETYAIGQKYREKGTSSQRWLQPQIDKARSYVTERAEDIPPRVTNSGQAKQEASQKSKNLDFPSRVMVGIAGDFASLYST